MNNNGIIGLDEQRVSAIREELSADGLTFDWVQKIADTLKTSTFSSQLSVATDFAQMLCALFALFIICKIVWKSWANGSQLEISQFIKPFVVGMCIIFFSAIASGVEFLADTMGLASQQFSNLCSEESEKQFNNVVGFVQQSPVIEEEDANQGLDQQADKPRISASENKEAANTEEDQKEYQSSIKGMLRKILDFPDTILTGLYNTIWSLLQSVCVLLASIVSCCILCMGFLGKCVLYFFGPFLFAMELIPGMEGRIIGWFKKYLTYCLYPCIINIMNGVLVLLMVTLTDFMLEQDFTNVLVAQEVYKMGMIHFIISLIGAFMFMSVPSVANQIMETASNGLGAAGLVPVSYIAGKTGDKIATGQKIGLGGVGKAAGGIVTGGVSHVVNAGANIIKGVGKKMSSDSNMKGGGNQ